jgi:putative toxin-antitoxin system antitoxin component (TIGR02293 family)
VSQLSKTSSPAKNAAGRDRHLKKDRDRLKQRTRNFAESDAASAVIERAVNVIGDEPDAMRWLGTPIRALAYATPVSLLHTPEGRNAVISVLGRLEHGVL